MQCLIVDIGCVLSWARIGAAVVLLQSLTDCRQESTFGGDSLDKSSTHVQLSSWLKIHGTTYYILSVYKDFGNLNSAEHGNSYMERQEGSDWMTLPTVETYGDMISENAW